MKGSTFSDAKKIGFDRARSIRSIASIAVLALVAVASAPPLALADEGGVSFWIPGFFTSHHWKRGGKKSLHSTKV